MSAATIATGHIFAVIGFHGSWPPKHESRVLGRQASECDIDVVVTQRATMRFSVRSGQHRRVVESHPLMLRGVGLALIDVGWDERSMMIHINGRPASGLPASNPPLEIQLGGLASSGMVSLNNPDVHRACAEWTKWRRRWRSKVRSTPKPGHRRKALTEQLDELERATLALADLIKLVQRGRLHLVGHVATILRALLYWRGKSHSPLLLRVAARFDLPLPVYYVPTRPSDELPTVPAQELMGGACSLFQTQSAQRLGDLQGWLYSKTLRLAEGRRRELTVIDAVTMTANTLGSAHYDEDVPVVLEAVLSFSGPTADALTSLIGTAASIVHPLSQFVLIEARKGAPVTETE